MAPHGLVSTATVIRSADHVQATSPASLSGMTGRHRSRLPVRSVIQPSDRTLQANTRLLTPTDPRAQLARSGVPAGALRHLYRVKEGLVAPILVHVRYLRNSIAEKSVIATTSNTEDVGVEGRLSQGITPPRRTILRESLLPLTRPFEKSFKLEPNVFDASLTLFQYSFCLR